ncbi:MAG: hypothetical protein RML93_11680 [Anaerolineales bacterium]|nr:hypothetical protein [Anaerolineales bacterium]MCS7248307.1 hypothetical protein [Anaerolineales bacterium]MDW8162121.1 hypothetical protein [Anaerolineales bacterium]MDW8447935.1 hypothetical protein [Anaerolineales bacterium]
MRLCGRSNVAEFLEDFIVYRNLAPMDERLPKLDDLRPKLNLPPGTIPRKHELSYAQVIVELLRAAQCLQNPRAELRRLVFIGDTRMSDGGAFDNICQVAGWEGIIFIGSENTELFEFESVQTAGGQTMVLSNRWSALNSSEEYNLRRYCAARGFPIDEHTAVIVDLDKTALGARGRNSQVIDRARVEAVRQTVETLLGDAFNLESFLFSYNQLNQPEFHPFTADNQDYLAYICLILGSGLYDTEKVIREVRGKRLLSFRQFIDQVETHKAQLAPSLQTIHDTIYANVQAGDPTPFKAFRYNEYRQTVQRMGYLPDATPLDVLLREEIVITQEVRALALDWKREGALLFGLSDKPDEASLPTPELAAKGYQPLHRTFTHVVGLPG